MNIKYRLYPYPVLASFSDSYVGSKFEVKADTPKIEGYEIKVELQAKLDNDGLKDLIRRGLASYVYHLECAQTGYRKVVPADNDNCKITIKDTEVNGNLELCSFVLANEDIVDYFNDNFNKEDYPTSVAIKKGCPLAIGNKFCWKVSKSNTDLLKSSSPFKICLNPDKSITHMTVECGSSDPKIRVYLCKNDYDSFFAMQSNPDVRSILNSMVVVPALIYALSVLQKYDDPEEMDSEFSGSWYDSIKESLSKRFNKDIKRIKEENVYELAQKLLRTPINDAISDLTHLGTKHLPEEDEG